MQMNHSVDPQHTFVVIMAGGVGSRFWPISRTESPKQFLDILGCGRTLIQMTYDRMLPMTAADQILVVTNARYRDDVAAALPDLPAENILCEPMMRNTAACLAYANSVIAQRDEAAQIVVASADHLIADEDRFRSVISAALGLAARSGELVSVGIEPTRPDTGYGYIQHGPRATHATGPADERLRSVAKFVEKPELARAQDFLASGDYAWNAGIFVWNLSDIQAAFRVHLPEMDALFSAHASDFGTDREIAAIEAIYGSCQNISIDYGIMERVGSVGLVLGDFGWSDLGTWQSLYQQLDRDAAGNATRGVPAEKLLLEGATGNMISAGDGKTVVLRGLDNFIVVDTPDALLICPRDQEQWVKTVVGELSARGQL
jgi:mannose-1-phosphate guanylyltransferase